MRLKRQLRKLTRWFREPPMQRPRTVSGMMLLQLAGGLTFAGDASFAARR
jgi:hypothetical protein